MLAGDESKVAMPLGPATMKLQAVFKERRGKAASGKPVWKYIIPPMWQGTGLVLQGALTLKGVTDMFRQTDRQTDREAEKCCIFYQNKLKLYPQVRDGFKTQPPVDQLVSIVLNNDNRTKSDGTCGWVLKSLLKQLYNNLHIHSVRELYILAQWPTITIYVEKEL